MYAQIMVNFFIFFYILKIVKSKKAPSFDF